MVSGLFQREQNNEKFERLTEGRDLTPRKVALLVIKSIRYPMGPTLVKPS